MHMRLPKASKRAAHAGKGSSIDSRADSFFVWKLVNTEETHIFGSGHRTKEKNFLHLFVIGVGTRLLFEIELVAARCLGTP